MCSSRNHTLVLSLKTHIAYLSMPGLIHITFNFFADNLEWVNLQTQEKHVFA